MIAGKPGVFLATVNQYLFCWGKKKKNITHTSIVWQRNQDEEEISELNICGNMQEKSGLGRVDQIAIIERVTRSQRSDLHRLIQSRCCLEKHCLVLSVGNSILWVTPKEHVPRQKFHGSKKYLPSEIIGLWLLWHHFEDGGMKTFWYPPIQPRSAGSQPTLRQTSEPSGKQVTPCSTQNTLQQTLKTYSGSKRRARVPDHKV